MVILGITVEKKLLAIIAGGLAVVALVAFFAIYFILNKDSVADSRNLDESLIPKWQPEAGSPIRLRIPKLKIDAGMQYAGVKPNLEIESPSNLGDVGWYKVGPMPGEEGSAVMTGHLVQIRNSKVMKQGVFYNLNTLKPGDEVSVESDQGAISTFVVRELRLYDATADAKDVFVSQSGAHLNLITCAGEWEQAKLSYTKRLVVFTDLKL